METPTSSRTVHLSLPIAAVPPVREATLHLCGATGEALHMTIQRLTDGSIELGEIYGYLERLDELRSLLGQLQVPSDSPALAVDLRATRDVLRDAVRGALIDVAERTAVSCGAWSSGAPAEPVLDLAKQVVDLETAVRQIPEHQ